MNINQIPDFSTYTKYTEKDRVYADDGSLLPNVRGEFFESVDNGGRRTTIGVFFCGKQKLYCAWGYMDEEHCSMFSVIGGSGEWISPQKGCPVKLTKKENGQVVALVLPTNIGEFVFSLI